MSEEIKESAAKENTEDKISLKTFIDDFQKTIAVIGVFIVLGLFWKNVYAEESTPYVSYLCFLITLPLLYEIWRAYDFDKSSWNLRVFITLFSGILFAIALHLLTAFPSHLATLATNLIWFGAIVIPVLVIDKIGSAINHFAYLNEVKYTEKLDKQNLTLEKRNEIVVERNKSLQDFYAGTRKLQWYAFILIIVFSFFVLYYTGQFLQGLVHMGENIGDAQVPSPPTDVR